MPIRMIHVGVGVRGRHWLDFVGAYADAQSVACVDVDAAALAAARRQRPTTPLATFTDLDQALGGTPADAVLIATPSALHAEHAIRALGHGLHVLVEKPFAMTVEDGEAVIRAAQAAGKHVMVAENYRFFPAERTVRRWIAGGRLGPLTTMTCIDRRAQPPADLKPWAAALRQPQLVEIAVHHFDTFRYLLDARPVRVAARCFNPLGSAYKSGAGTHAMIEMEGGTTVLYAGWLSSHRYEYELWVEGEAGALWTDRKRVWWRARGARFFRPVRLDKSVDGRRYPRAGTTALLDQFRDAVLHGREPETGAPDNLWTIAMLDAAVRSAGEAGAVEIGFPRPVLSSSRVAAHHG
jgi:predicted dehydrogenase